MTNLATTAYTVTGNQVPLTTVRSLHTGLFARTLMLRSNLTALTDRPSWLTGLRTLGYSSIGVGAAAYRYQASAPAHSLYETDGDGNIWEQVSGGPMARGANGDGATDDSAILDLFEDTDYQPAGPIDLEGRTYEYDGTWDPAKRYINGTVIDDARTRHHGNGLLTQRAIASAANLLLADAYDTLIVWTATATLTIREDATANLPIGCPIPLMVETGTGTVAVSGAATINGGSSSVEIASGTNSAATLIKRAANTWRITGALA